MSLGDYGYGDGIVSNSAIHDAMTCPHKYYVKHVLNQEATIESSYFTIGKAVHTIAENLYSDPKLLKADETEQRNWCVQQLQEQWELLLGADNHLIIKTYRAQYQQAIVDTIDWGKRFKNKTYKLPTQTQYWERTYTPKFKELEETLENIKTSIPQFRFKDPLLDVYNASLVCVENLAKLYRKFPAAEKILHETKIDPPIEIFGVKKSGKIDRLDFTVDGEILLYDYKTGKKYWTRTDVANSDQLCWYRINSSVLTRPSLSHFERWWNAL
jgi:ATP-dependent helicase/DNAse subunit B